LGLIAAYSDLHGMNIAVITPDPAYDSYQVLINLFFHYLTLSAGCYMGQDLE
jgi:hypothetical protein